MEVALAEVFRSLPTARVAFCLCERRWETCFLKACGAGETCVWWWWRWWWQGGGGLGAVVLPGNVVLVGAVLGALARAR